MPGAAAATAAHADWGMAWRLCAGRGSQRGVAAAGAPQGRTLSVGRERWHVAAAAAAQWGGCCLMPWGRGGPT